MAARFSLWRRIKWTISIVFLLAVVLFVGEVFRRYFEREELAAIHRVLDAARKGNAPLSEFDPEWESLSESLRTRLEAAPSGPLAILAHRTKVRVSLDMPGAVSLADRSTVTIRYGDLIEREVPVPDQPYLWTIEIQGSWNNGPYVAWQRDSWGGSVASVQSELDIATGLSEADREKRSAFLKLRSILRFYLGKHAVAAAEANGPEELARVPFVFQERRRLGSFKVWTRGVPAP